jgi:O-antigen/teichoic acid export membrane protein
LQKISSIKKVIFNSGLYAIVSILQKAIGFFLLPIYTLYLTPADYGVTGLVISLTSVLSMFLTLSLGGAVSRFYFDYRDDPEKLRTFWGTIVLFIIFNSAFLGLLIILFQQYLLAPFIKGVSFYPYIFIGVLTIIVSPIYTIYQGILQTLEEAGKYSVNSSLNFLLLVVCNILFIVVFRIGAEGMLLAPLVTGIVFAAYSLYSLVKNKFIYLTFRKEYIVESLQYSLPLMPHLMSGVIADFVSRIFLNNEASTAYLGIFNVGAQFLIIIDTLQMSVNNAYIPWFYGLMSRGDSEHYKIINFADLLLRANCVLSLALAFFIKEIIQIMTNPAYVLAWVVVPIMLIAYQIRGIYLFYVNTLFYNKKATRLIFVATLSGNLISIVLSALLTQRLGLFTPAIVLIVEKIVTTSIVVYISKQVEPIDFRLSRMLLYIGILIIGMGIGLFFDMQSIDGPINLADFLYKCVVFLLFAFFILRKDFKNILKVLKQRCLMP